MPSRPWQWPERPKTSYRGTLAHGSPTAGLEPETFRFKANYASSCATVGLSLGFNVPKIYTEKGRVISVVHIFVKKCLYYNIARIAFWNTTESYIYGQNKIYMLSFMPKLNRVWSVGRKISSNFMCTPEAKINDYAEFAIITLVLVNSYQKRTKAKGNLCFLLHFLH